MAQLAELWAGLAVMLRRVGTWQQDGTWDALVQLAGVVKGMDDSLTARIVERIMSVIADATMMDMRNVVDSGLVGLSVRATEELAQVVNVARADTSRVTLTRLIL